MLTEFQKTKLTTLFSMYDADNDGAITLADFEVMLDKFAQVRSWTPGSAGYEGLKTQLVSRWQTMQQAADTNQDDEISQAEWLAYIEQMLNDSATYEAEVNAISAAVLNIFDLDGDGQLELEEYRNFYRAVGIDETVADGNFSRLDLDNNGYITKEEHLTLLHQYFYSQDPDAPGNLVFGPY